MRKTFFVQKKTGNIGNTTAKIKIKTRRAGIIPLLKIVLDDVDNAIRQEKIMCSRDVGKEETEFTLLNRKLKRALSPASILITK